VEVIPRRRYSCQHHPAGPGVIRWQWASGSRGRSRCSSPPTASPCPPPTRSTRHSMPSWLRPTSTTGSRRGAPPSTRRARRVASPTLEASAAMKSIVRRDTGEDWKGYVTRLMREGGVIGPGEEPSAEDARRFDRNRPGKTVSNAEWASPTDADARIARMKDGTTHLAYKAEHVVDLAT